MTPFTDTLWQDIAELNKKNLALPFIRDLTAGTLDHKRFKFYVMQDSLYLNSYSRALSLTAAKATHADAMLRFAKSAQEAITVERALHAGFLRQFGVSDAELKKAEKSPACAAYTNFLLATAAVGSYEELAAAILPCFWIYWYVGHEIAKVAKPDNPYIKWINTYTDPGFEEAVKAVIALTEEAAQNATLETCAAMRKAFVLSSVYEWMFWDSAYRRETWPVSA